VPFISLGSVRKKRIKKQFLILMIIIKEMFPEHQISLLEIETAYFRSISCDRWMLN